MKRKYLLYIVFVLILAVFLYMQRNANRDFCIEQQNIFNTDEYKGEVIRLFKDSTNHMYESLLIATTDDTISKWQFGTETTNSLYSNVQVGDTIIKKKGENYLYLKRNGQVQSYEVDLKCEEKTLF